MTPQTPGPITFRQLLNTANAVDPSRAVPNARFVDATALLLAHVLTDPDYHVALKGTRRGRALLTSLMRREFPARVLGRVSQWVLNELFWRKERNKTLTPDEHDVYTAACCVYDFTIGPPSKKESV